MYYCEWALWKAKLETDEDRKNDKEIYKKLGLKEIRIYESDLNEVEAAAKLSVSHSSKTSSPVYEFNDNILEMRCGLWEAKRGFITLFSLLITIVIWHSFSTSIALLPSFFNPISNYKSYIALILATIISLTTFSVVLWLYLKYGLRIARLEQFTSRHLLIRFNRKTRQVHLHRPSYCGGIMTLPWEGVSSSGTDKDASGAPLALFWSQRASGLPYLEVVWVGKITRTHAQARDEWEFIRRFMDEGPEGLPRPRITSHFPWPWQAFTPQFEGLTPFSQCSWITRFGLLMIWPAFVIFGVCHWLSLLLCWKPRWPKVIREAGLPGKPIPPLSTLADRPPHIQERLLANAHLWAVIPGKRPEKKPRASRSRRKTSRPNVQQASRPDE